MDKKPHVIFLPFPAQGHIKPLLTLARLLHLAGFDITFINSDHNHHRLLYSAASKVQDCCNPKFQFVSLPDGLPPDHPRSGPSAVDLFWSTRSVMEPKFREMVVEISRAYIAEEMEIPILVFRTYSACCTWTYFHLSSFVETGEIPVRGEDMDKPIITCIPGLEGLLRHRDLPNICRWESNDPVVSFFISETSRMARASALILDTFDDLEGTIISRLGTIFTKIYTIGPLHGLLRSRTATTNFGSQIVLSHEQLLEFWYGLVNSGKPFLWVIRVDQVEGHECACPGQGPDELERATKERGLMVNWAPQEEIADQPVNSRCISELWKIGFDMKDVCNRNVVEKMLRDVMDDKGAEIVESVNCIAKKARESVEVKIGISVSPAFQLWKDFYGTMIFQVSANWKVII
ncbi:7-deoxyloganetic acid glucosyltransferase-like [Punica granatum]|uniref:7-deoxyloganetic acid glucosyltransferase-like n=1 Tax=Punica granatum TaxID=22663 RepID=A0A6P8C7G9_PUNGR|nr:7-deoxyloganetic acid glucosyltransferase-like [Punica granatum]